MIYGIAFWRASHRQIILRAMKRSIWILLAMVLITFGFGVDQTRMIQGKITSKTDGAGIPGVSVLIKGTSTATASNADGTYKIYVPASGATLVFSFVSYKTVEVKVTTETVVNVVLEDDVTQLD